MIQHQTAPPNTRQTQPLQMQACKQLFSGISIPSSIEMFRSDHKTSDVFRYQGSTPLMIGVGEFEYEMRRRAVQEQ